MKMALIQPTELFGNRDPPFEKPKEQYLFLLEFFVYRVTGERLAKLNQMFFVPTRVRIKFLNFEDEDIAVTPVDPMFEPQSGIGDDIEHFNSGRSVMFAIARDEVIEKSYEFKLNLTIEKKMPKNIKPDILVGEGEIDMSKHFAALRKEMLQCWHMNYPPPKIFEGNVDIYHEKKCVGGVEIYVRISGFGESIITEIESPNIEKKSSNYVFKSAENNDKQLAYKCRVISSSKLDVCKNSKEDLREKPDCQVCQPTRYVCSPCELNGAKGKSFGFPSIQRDGRNNRSGGEPDETVRSVLHGKPITAPWNPQSSSRKNLNNEEFEKIHEFREHADLHSLPIQSSRGPAVPCGKAVVLKVSGLLDVDDADGRRKQPSVTIAGESDSRDPNVDPEHDVFILRIGKKGLVGADEKSDIQLEMRTPKGPERRPPIRYETREMQTDDDIKEKVKAKSKKGNGKKNKKKKK